MLTSYTIIQDEISRLSTFDKQADKKRYGSYGNQTQEQDSLI